MKLRNWWGKARNFLAGVVSRLRIDEKGSFLIEAIILLGIMIALGTIFNEELSELASDLFSRWIYERGIYGPK